MSIFALLLIGLDIVSDKLATLHPINNTHLKPRNLKVVGKFLATEPYPPAPGFAIILPGLIRNWAGLRQRQNTG